VLTLYAVRWSPVQPGNTLPLVYGWSRSSKAWVLRDGSSHAVPISTAVIFPTMHAAPLRRGAR
jgi:hypothetical protein